MTLDCPQPFCSVPSHVSQVSLDTRPDWAFSRLRRCLPNAPTSTFRHNSKPPAPAVQRRPVLCGVWTAAVTHTYQGRWKLELLGQSLGRWAVDSKGESGRIFPGLSWLTALVFSLALQFLATDSVLGLTTDVTSARPRLAPTRDERAACAASAVIDSKSKVLSPLFTIRSIRRTSSFAFGSAVMGASL